MTCENEKVLELDEIRIVSTEWHSFKNTLSIESDALGGCYSCTGPSLDIEITPERAELIIKFLKAFLTTTKGDRMRPQEYNVQLGELVDERNSKNISIDEFNIKHKALNDKWEVAEALKNDK